MTNDTKWIVGTGVAVITAVIGSAVAVIAVVVTLSGDIRADIRETNASIESLDDRFDGLDVGLRAVEVALDKLARVVETLQRLHLSPPPAGE